MIFAGDPEPVLPENQVGSFAVDVEVFAEVSGVADEIEGRNDVAFEQSGDAGDDFDVAAPVLAAGEDFERLEAGDVEQRVEFVAAGVGDEAAGILEGVVAPGAGDGGLPVFDVVGGDGPDGAPAAGEDFVAEGAEGGPVAALVGDGEGFPDLPGFSSPR